MKESTEALKQKIADAKKQVSVGGKYKHYKGNFYNVIDIAIMESDTELCVIYEADYAPGLLFVRPLQNWLEQVEADGGVSQRFQKIS
jgi:hypothetical protein